MKHNYSNLGKTKMNKNDVIEFFDRLAGQWDKDMVRNENIICQILDNAKVSEGKDILDVACGTGVLIPDYLARNVKTVTAIDISPEMVKIAKKKFGCVKRFRAVSKNIE